MVFDCFFRRANKARMGWFVSRAYCRVLWPRAVGASCDSLTRLLVDACAVFEHLRALGNTRATRLVCHVDAIQLEMRCDHDRVGLVRGAPADGDTHTHTHAHKHEELKKKAERTGGCVV